MEVSVSRDRGFLLSQEASAPGADLEADSGKGYLGFLRLQEEWCAGFDDRSHHRDRPNHWRNADYVSSRSPRQASRGGDPDCTRRYSCPAAFENAGRRWWRWW